MQDVAGARMRIDGHVLRRLEHDPLQLGDVGLLHGAGELGNPITRHVGSDRRLHRVKQRRQRGQEVPGGQLRTDRLEQLLLAVCPREVAVARPLPRADKGQGRVAIHVMRAGLDEEAGLLVKLVGVGGVIDRPLDRDVDAPDGVDRLLEAEEVDRREVVDRHAQQVADGRLQRSDTAQWKLVGPRGCIGHEGVQLVVVEATAGQRDAVEVPGDRDHG